MLTERLTGVAMLSFGLLLYFWLIPYDTEIVDYGWMRPQTIPNLMALIIAISGGWLILRPAPQQESATLRPLLLSTVYFIVLALTLLAIAHFGFLYVAPGLALVIMLLSGERRWHWLLSGTVLVPLVIWLVVSVWLGRLLP